MKNRKRQTAAAVGLIVGGCVLFILCAMLHQILSEPPVQTPAPRRGVSAAPVLTPPLTPAPTSESTPEPSPTPGPLIVIDPGHQLHGDYGQEQIGPGAAETKARVTDGAEGVVTGIPEYELNLTVSLLLRDELEARGYRVVLTRETNEVSLSNAERAAIANELQADAFVRIHANASDDPAVCGVMTICMTAQNPFNSSLYPSSRALAEALLCGLGDAVGCNERQRTLWETDSMSGINHSLVPVCIVEMGYMSNPIEDRLLADDAYRQQIVLGLADGLDAWLENKSK